MTATRPSTEIAFVAQPSSDRPWGIYVHVPWCRSRCAYCAFYVEVDRDTPWDTYVEKVIEEYHFRKSEFPGQPATLFLGGGTPSRMPPDALRRLLLGFDLDPSAEISVEANPEDIDDEWLETAISSGIHRVSLGMQTLDARFARLLNRSCSVQDAARTLYRVAQAGFVSWSVDLMFGLPSQTVDDLDADLDRLLAAAPPHVSLYGLTIEEGTPFERARDRGSIIPVDDDQWRIMYDHIVSRLRAAGFERYEVSNFAQPGHRSRHNTLYWTDHPYLGLGPSAHGYTPSGRRWRNVPDVRRYLLTSDPTHESESPEPRQRAIDLLVSSLRTVDGVSLKRLRETTWLEIPESFTEPWVRAGVLRHADDRITLTDEGMPLADGLAARLSDGLRDLARIL